MQLLENLMVIVMQVGERMRYLERLKICIMKDYLQNQNTESVS